MTARIYRPARNAMQSGNGKSKQWVLVHEMAAPREIDPLMGYTTSTDTRQQVRRIGRSLRAEERHRLFGSACA
jgi:hypothetical protein